MRREIKFLVALYALAIFLSTSCTRGEWDGQPENYESIKNPGGKGPEVLFKPDEEPVPLIPFPCDIMAKADHRTPSGMRVNVPESGETEVLREIRKNLNELDGFTTFGRITVSFSDPIDLETISNETVFLINVDEKSDAYGELVALDFGYGYFPISINGPLELYPYDPYKDADNIIFPPENRVTYYEDATNTLIIRPVVPLLPKTKYAVVLTRKILGEDGEPIRPPDWFEFVTFPNQMADVWRAAQILKESKKIKPQDIGFAWVFTTQTTYWILEEIYKGLHGEGPFAQLESEFTPKITVIDPFSLEIERDNDMYRFEASYFQSIISVILQLIPEAQTVPWDKFLAMDQVDYFVVGTYKTPKFLVGEDRIFQVYPDKNLAYYESEEVPFFISIPKSTPENGYAKPPYPVMIFLHANFRCRIDVLALANELARFGIASIGIDAAEHGPETYLVGPKFVLDHIVAAGGPLADAIALVLKAFMFVFFPSIDTSQMTPQEVEYAFWHAPLFGPLLKGRAVDEYGLGVTESGRSFFQADVRRPRDLIRQTVVDLFQLTRIIKKLGYDFNNNGRIDREEGDFNQDGILDMGGPDNPIYFSSMSLGSIMGPAFVALEPEIEAAVLNVPGAGLVDTLSRSDLPQVKYYIGHDLVGPVIVGRADPENPAYALLTYNDKDLNTAFERILTKAGYKAVLKNLKNEEEDEMIINEQGGFALAVPCDKNDPLELSIYDDKGLLYDRKRWTTALKGFGVKRNTPEMRYFQQIGQWLIDSADPINYAPLFVLRPRLKEKKRVLFQLCATDTAIPLASGLSLARAAGFISPERNLKLIELGVTEWEKINSFKLLNCPLESKYLYGYRIHPGYNHEYFLAPRDKPNSIMYSFLSKKQLGLFFKYNGEIIFDRPELLVPPEYIWEEDEQCDEEPF